VLEVSEVAAKQHGEVAALYCRVGYGGGIGASDTVIGGRMGGKMVAAVRVASENGHLVLRGMYVDERFRRQGIGSALLASVESHLGLRGCWCIPYSHLRKFYAAIGFGDDFAMEVPGFLVNRLESYLEAGRPVVLMWRPGRPRSCGRSE